MLTEARLERERLAIVITTIVINIAAVSLLTLAPQKAVGILYIITLSFLIIHGINAMQAALLSRQRLDQPDNPSARRIYTAGLGDSQNYHQRGPNHCDRFRADAFRSGAAVRHKYSGFRWNCRHRDGFAVQRTLGNLLAGIQIALTQPLLIDDIVVVEGECGQIEEITLTYVTVRTWDLRRMILPITYFVEKPFQNWSRVSTDLLGAVLLYLDYQAPVGEMRKELKRLVENNPNGIGRFAGCK